MTTDEIKAKIEDWNKRQFMFKTATAIYADGRDVPKPLVLFVAPFDRQPNGMMGCDLVYQHNGEVAVHLKLNADETLDTVREVLAVAWPMAQIKFPSVLA